MGQPRAKTGAKLRPNRANIGQQQQQPPQPRAKTGANLRPNTTTTTTKNRDDNDNNNNTSNNNNTTSSGCRVYFCRRPAVRRKPHKSGQGPPGRVLAVGVSLLSVGERGCTPCRRPLPPAKKSRVLRCFVLFPFFLIFRILWLKMGQHGPT